jgi:hypothetical protein
MTESQTIVPIEAVERRILLIRGQKVLLDMDLAELYVVETKALKRAVRRNRSRFPFDFMFELTSEEYRILRCQIGTLKRGQHTKNLPRRTFFLCLCLNLDLDLNLSVLLAA